MLNWTIRTSLFLLGLALFAAPGLTQGRVLSRYKQPLTTVTLDLETGALVRGPQIQQQSVTTVSDFANLDLAGFVGVDTGGGFCEWMDSGIKGSGVCSPANPSDLISNFTFAYCSAAASVNSGGPGGSMTWSFFPSHTTGANHPATSSAIGIFNLTGLPAHTGTGSLFASISCFYVDISFGNTPLPFPDGRFGYSWTFQGSIPGTALAPTFPFLSCVMSCSGSGPSSCLGIDDYLDQYCPAGVSGAPPLSSFSFGTTAFGGYFTSIAIDLRELCLDASLSTYDGVGLNTDVLQTTSAIIGQDWTATVTPRPGRTASPPSFGVALVLIRDGGLPGVSIILDLAPILVGFGSAPLSELLTSGTLLGSALLSHDGTTTTVPATIPIPLNTSFLSMPWFAQSIVFGDVTTDGVVDLDPTFSTATSGTVGAQ